MVCCYDMAMFMSSMQSGHPYFLFLNLAVTVTMIPFDVDGVYLSRRRLS
jgi:hypothetical protein